MCPGRVIHLDQRTRAARDVHQPQPGGAHVPVLRHDHTLPQKHPGSPTHPGEQRVRRDAEETRVGEENGRMSVFPGSQGSPDSERSTRQLGSGLSGPQES